MVGNGLGWWWWPWVMPQPWYGAGSSGEMPGGSCSGCSPQLASSPCAVPSEGQVLVGTGPSRHATGDSPGYPAPTSQSLCRLGKSTPNAAWFYKRQQHERGSRDFPSASFSFFPKPSFPGDSPGLAFISNRARFGERLLSILIKLHPPLCAETLLRSLQRCHPKITQ